MALCSAPLSRPLILIALLAVAACSDRATPTSATPIIAAPEFHIVSGKVTDTELAPMADAVITAVANGRQTTVGYNGDFLLRTETGHTVFTVARDGYETRLFAIQRTAADVSVDVILQPLIVIDSGSVAALTLSKRDLPHYVAEPYESDYCSPCKMIRLRTPANAQLRVELSWQSDDALGLWVQGQKVESTSAGRALAMVPGTGGEVILHVGRIHVAGQPGMARDAAFALSTLEVH